MKIIKAVALGTVLALAAMALGGASSASAVSALRGCLGELVFKNGHMTCVGEYHLDGVMKFEAGATTSSFSGGFVETCGKSTAGLIAKMGEEAGVEGAYSVSSLSFGSECKPCSKVEAVGLPYINGKFTMPSEVENDFVFESTTKVAFSGCPLEITCKFGSKEAKLQYVESEGLSANELRAEGASLKLEGGSSEICGSVTKWSANYVVAMSEWFFLLG